jgi:hypothetical protein
MPQSNLEKHLHGAITAFCVQTGDDTSIEGVIDMLERRFGIAPETAGKDVTRDALDRCTANLEAAMEHLRPDTVDWFKQRIAYILHHAKQRTVYSD